ncbi:hypothetical protein BH20ACI1_BH20ACI1_14210 [soil metagenome]
MKKILMLLVIVAVCGCFILVNQNRRSEARTDTDTTAVSVINDADVSEINYEENDKTFNVTPPQQVGMRCSIYPRCPDCAGKGNVCRGAEEFFPGVTVIAKGKSLMVSKCRQANALDYCGGSRGCMRKTRQEQERHKRNFGGGCYAQCQEKNVRCVLDNR